MLKALIFDMDGTLTLTEPLHHKAYAAVFAKYGINDFSYEEEIEKYAGSGSKNIFTKVFQTRGVSVSPMEIEKCIAEKRSLYKKSVQEEEILLIPGVKEFVKKVHGSGLKKIIATGNSDLEAVRFILEKAGLSEYFPELLSISEVARGKPAPDVFIEAVKRLHVEPSECVVFEDAVNGVTAAHAAGLRCIALETSEKRKNLSAAGADFVVKDYSEVTDEMLYG